MNQIKIIPISLDYIKDFHQVLDSVAKEQQYLLFTEAPSIERATQFVQSQLTANNPHFLAQVNNQVIGWCDIRRETVAAIAHCGTLGMGVLASFRSQGIGEQLMRTALAKAKSIGMERVELSVIVSNQRAYKLYQKIGFVEEGIKRRSVKLRGQYFDRILMALDLSNFD